MKKVYHYRTTLYVQNGLGVIARITIMLRKFNVNIQSIDVVPLDDNKDFYDIHLVLDSTKNREHIAIVMKKLERLIPVVRVTYNLCDGAECYR